MMKLFTTPASPWTRKCIITVMELGLEDKVERIPTRWPHIWATKTIEFTPDFAAATPVGRIPALVTESGLQLCDSFAICDYLDAEHGNYSLLPKSGEQRWKLMSITSIANGLLEAQILRRGELLRADGERSDDFLVKMQEREERCYRALDEMVDWFEADVDLAQITTGVTCGYADFRFPDEDWRSYAPKLAAWYDDKFSKRRSMQSTIPQETPQ